MDFESGRAGELEKPEQGLPLGLLRPLPTWFRVLKILNSEGRLAVLQAAFELVLLPRAWQREHM